MNPKSREAILAKTRNAIASGEYTRGYLVTWNNDFHALSAEVLKSCSKWLEPFDVTEIVRGYVTSHLPHNETEGYTGKLSKFFDPPKVEEVAELATAYFASLPRSYQVFIPLPRFKTQGEIPITNDIAFIRSAEQKNALSRGLLAPLQTGPTLRSDTTYLRVNSQGYASARLSQSAIRDALSIAKRVLQLGAVKFLFTADHTREISEIYAELLGGDPTAKVTQAVVIDRESAKANSYVRLSSGASRYLTSMKIFDDSVEPEGLQIPLIKASNLTNDLRAQLEMPARLVTEDEFAENTKSIRSGLEWAFDADADDEPVMSFIKTCIALEAVLGEETDEERVTERLADRCAFLLNETSKERSNTRRRIRDVYRLRSKVVHGTRTRITADDENLRFDAAIHLSAALRTEVAAVENWAKTRRHIQFKKLDE